MQSREEKQKPNSCKSMATGPDTAGDKDENERFKAPGEVGALKQNHEPS